MDRHVHRHHVAADQLLGKVANNRRLLGCGNLRREGQLPLAPTNGVHTGLARLGRVLQPRPVLRPSRGMGRDDVNVSSMPNVRS